MNCSDSKIYQYDEGLYFSRKNKMEEQQEGFFFNFFLGFYVSAFHIRADVDMLGRLQLSTATPAPPVASSQWTLPLGQEMDWLTSRYL